MVHHGTSFSAPRRLPIVINLIVLLCSVGQTYASDDDHVCFRYESYTELETVPRNQTVQVLTREWCLEIPPRCTSYRPEIKEVYVKQNVTRSRRIEYCCEGYEERRRPMEQEIAAIITSVNNSSGLSCHPICRGGCGRGVCESPNNCDCEAGFTGKHCNQRCRNGTWGINCKHRCHCQNSSLCDGKTGHCRCSDGWIGNHCEFACPAGHYGTMCKTSCNCSTARCHHITGACLVDDEQVMFDNITRVMENNFSGESTERISAEQWIKVDSSTTTSSSTTTGSPISTNSTYAESYQEYIPSNATVSMVPVEELKSTTETPQNDTVYEIRTSTTKVEITFIDTSVNKVESTDAESVSAEQKVTRRPEVVFVETENQSDLVEYVESRESSSEEETEEPEVNNKQAIVTISCLLLTLGLLLSVVAYMKNLNRKAIRHQQKQLDACESRGPDSPRILEPLPDIPKVIYTKVKAKNQRNGTAQLEHYDVPVNNSSVNKSSPYNYNFTMSKPLFPQQPANGRKYSLEHIYDEIQYDGGGTTEDSNAGDHFSKSIFTDSKMTPVKVIDEIKGKS